MAVKTDKKKETSAASNGAVSSTDRVEVLKTYKIYIGGKFPRTESGRYYKAINNAGDLLANICLSSRKDFRNAVVAARGAMGSWAGKSAFNRSQILYRIGEMLEGRKAQFVDELMKMDYSKKQAENEVNLSVDRLIYYAGWCDKYQQLFSSVNPVASSHFNFSAPEPTGVVAAIASEDYPLLGLVSVMAPIIAGGNTAILLASDSKPLCSISFAEVINSSDVPGGVVNILTGKEAELYEHFSTHMDVNAIIYARNDQKVLKEIQQNATGNFKRVYNWNDDCLSEESQNPYKIIDCQETKTTWHPIENIGAAGSGY